jgi:predicted TPR repeat methyltransferase
MLKWLNKIASKKQTPQQTITDSPTQRAEEIDSTVFKAQGDKRLKAGAVDEAIRLYRQALSINPAFAEAHNMLGDALREQNQLGEAARSYRAALEHAPQLAEAHYGLGVTLLERSDAQNAAVCFQTALGLKADFAKAHNGLGFTFLVSGKQADALTCFQRTLHIDPDDGMAMHLTASLTGSNPERPPDQYVEKLFDGFAATFDNQLQQLKYETPKHLMALVAQVSTPASGKWCVLDLGCGTGLVGVEVAPYSQQLVGVDLSSKMLAKARARNLYHRLEQADLVSMMSNEAASSYDLVTAADTFIYVGKLEDVTREAKRLLRPGGLFAFSVEALETLPNPVASQNSQQEYLLQASPSCRYAHSASYLSRLAAENDLKMHPIKMEHLRMSCGQSVTGYLVLLENSQAN